MRKVFRFFIPVSLIVLILLVAVTTAEAQVVINEFMPDPARDWDGDGEYNYRDDEWVEILNTGESAVDLSGYLISDGTGLPVWRYGFSGIIGPGETVVVYGSDSRAWEESNGQPVYGLSLNNAGDQVSLYRISGMDTVLVESVPYNDKAAGDDRSIGRSVLTGEAWELFDAYNPCQSCDPTGNGCIPTPGQANTCTTGTGDDSWGSIKQKYMS